MSQHEGKGRIITVSCRVVNFELGISSRSGGSGVQGEKGPERDTIPKTTPLWNCRIFLGNVSLWSGDQLWFHPGAANIPRQVKKEMGWVANMFSGHTGSPRSRSLKQKPGLGELQSKSIDANWLGLGRFRALPIWTFPPSWRICWQSFAFCSSHMGRQKLGRGVNATFSMEFLQLLALQFKQSSLAPSLHIFRLAVNSPRPAAQQLVWTPSLKMPNYWSFNVLFESCFLLLLRLWWFGVILVFQEDNAILLIIVIAVLELFIIMAFKKKNKTKR